MAVVVAASLTACGGTGTSGTGEVGEAFCSDLRAGMTPAQILGAKVKSGEYTPRKAADRAYAWAATECPEQLKSNETLRGYLDGFGIDPDA